MKNEISQWIWPIDEKCVAMETEVNADVFNFLFRWKLIVSILIRLIKKLNKVAAEKLEYLLFLHEQD